MSPCECEECACDQYAEPESDLCYDCDHGIHLEDRL